MSRTISKVRFLIRRQQLIPHDHAWEVVKMRKLALSTFFAAMIALSGCSPDSLVGSETDYVIEVGVDTHNVGGDTHN